MIETLELIVLVLLAIAAACLLVYWSAVGYHVARTMIRIPTVRRGLATSLDEHAMPPVCVIVPAHNEEACIATVATSLARQDYPADRLRLVFVLDRCTDGTRKGLEGAVANTGGAGERTEIIELRSCPPGWVGKSHALWTGVQNARSSRSAELLLFVDADTELDQRLVRAAVGLLRERELGMLSLLSTLTYDHWFEKVVQPAAGMELLRQYPLSRANDPKRPRPFANGQFILIRRDAYEKFGGHEAVRSEVLEDVSLARHARWNGVACGFFLDDGLLRCRMYDSYRALRRGWKRIYGESANRKPARLRRIARRLRLVAAGLPALAAAAVAAGLALRGGINAPAAIATAALGIAGLAVWFSVVVWCYALAKAPLVWAISHPIGAWLAGGVMREAAADLEGGKPTLWGGLELTRESR